MLISCPPSCLKALQMLNEAGYEAFIVGGCVRDSLLGKAPKDWDICTAATPEEMMAVFAGERIIPTGIAHGTLTVLIEGTPYEITTYRIDGEYIDHRRPESITYTTSLAEDLARRDFTINAMAWHPDVGLVDLYGGEADLADRIVRAVGDPYERFQEDGLRIMRLLRFATVLDFDYEARTAEAARALVPLLQHISKERLQVELNKILLAGSVDRGLEDLRGFRLWPYLMPELCPSVGFAQESRRHFLDVFEHSCLATALVPATLPLRLTMLLHDIGKPFTWEVDAEGEDAFPAHEAESARLADQALRNLKYDNKTRRRVVQLIAHHNDILLLDRALLRRQLSRLGDEALLELIEVKLADINAHHIKGERQEVCALFGGMRTMVLDILASGEPYRIKDLAVDGRTLIERGYQGPAIGDALEQLLDFVLEDPSRNERATLLALLDAETFKKR